MDFFNLRVNQELICSFLAKFSRMEYALKETRQYLNNNATPNWDKFANNIDHNFTEIVNRDEELKNAVNYLKQYPPKKQSVEDGNLVFIETDFDPTQKETQQILMFVRRVRNNLFHGGKYRNNNINGNRDEDLIKYSLLILDKCKSLDEEVEMYYKQY